MNSDTQLKIQAYLDNELSPGEARKLAAMLSSHREAQDLYAELRATKEAIRTNEPERKLEDSRDFYWSQLQRRIVNAEREPAPKTSPLWVRWLAPVVGTAALFALLTVVMNPGARLSGRSEQTISAASPVHPVQGEIEDLVPEISSVTFRSEEHGVTVVWLTSRD